MARKYKGISGSDIANAVLMAAFKAAQQNSKIVEHEFVCEKIEATIASKTANERKKIAKISEEEMKAELKKYGANVSEKTMMKDEM